MNVQTLSNLFATSYSHDPNVRRAGELEIRRVGVQEGALAALLQIVGSNDVELPARQACTLYLKNRVHKSYAIEPTRPRPDQAPIAQSDRDALRSSILPLLVASPSRAISVQLASTLKILVANDFPEKWPTLLDEVKGLLRSGNIQEIHAGCMALLEVVRAFRFRQKNDILPEVVVQTFPALVNIATQLLSTPSASTSEDTPSILHLILKTYKTSIVLHLSKHQQSAESLVPWGRLLFQVVNLQIPLEVVPSDEEARERSEWWKAKKWAYSTLGRLFHRFGNPSQLPSPLKDDYGAFADHFVSAFAPEIFKTYLQQVQLFVAGQAWLSKKCQYLIFQFFTECVKPKSTWALVKPQYEFLVSSFVYPQLSFNAVKQELWQTDPVEYIRTSIDEYENFATPVSSATTFLLALAGNRTKITFMPILGIINTVLRSDASPPQKFGALNMTAALGPFIMRHPDVKPNMEQFMVQHVLPEFSSSEGYMRAIACEVLGTVEKAGMMWSTEEILNAHFRAVATALDDPELPVRIHAALALTEMITMHESVRAAVGPQVGKVVQDLLKLSDETDLDILNSSMETIVESFPDELMPVAAQLTARLCETYMRLVGEVQVQDEEDGVDLDTYMSKTGTDGDEDKTFAAMGVCKTIGTILDAVETNHDILLQVHEIIIPIITSTLEKKILDLFDNMYDLVDSLTFKLRQISPSMWPVFQLTYTLFKSDAIDFLDEMLPSLDNFVSFGTDAFKARPEYRMMVLDIYVTSMKSEQLGENDRVNGCRLAESLLLNLRGCVDDSLQAIISTALEYLGKAETSALELANLEVLINAALYNPSAALHLMEAQRQGIARAFFDKWFMAINSEHGLPRVHDKKLSIMAICALLEMDPDTIPENLKDGWAGMVAGALEIFRTLPKAIAARKALEDSFQEDDDDDTSDDVDLLNLNEDEEDVWDEDSEYMEMLAKEGARLKERAEKTSSIDGDEEDEDEDDVPEEELGYISPLDNIDPYSAFKQALTTFQMKNGPGYQAATTSLSMERQTLLMEVMRIAGNPSSEAA